MRKINNLLLLVLCSVLVITSCSNSDDYELIPVKMNGKYGYINQKGKYVINPQFNDATCFSEDIAIVRFEGKYGFINKKGEYVVNPMYKDVTRFNKGLAFVAAPKSPLACINKDGETKFTLENYQVVSEYSDDGIALAVKFSGGIDMLDTNGEIIKSLDSAKTIGYFNEGMAFYVNQYGSYGFINTKGELVIEPQFKTAMSFSEGLCPVQKGDHYGYINKEGELVINYQYDLAYPFTEDRAIIKLGSKYGYIDKTGLMVINAQFDDANMFKNGLANVKIDNKWGYIDKDGKYVINPQFESNTYFLNNDLAIVESDKKIGAINREGKYEINPQFDDINLSNKLNSYIKSDYQKTISLVEHFSNIVESNKKFDGIEFGTSSQSLERNKDDYKGKEFTDNIVCLSSEPKYNNGRISRITYCFKNNGKKENSKIAQELADALSKKIGIENQLVEGEDGTGYIGWNDLGKISFAVLFSDYNEGDFPNITVILTFNKEFFDYYEGSEY